GRRPGRVLDQHGASALPGRARGPARKAACRMSEPDLSALAGALRALTPRPATLDRDAVLFRAGQAAAPRRWLWPAATAASAALALTLGLMLVLRPAPRPIERVVYVPVERPAPPAPAAPVAEEPSSVPAE